MIAVTVTIGDAEAKMLASVDCCPSFPYGTSRSEKQEFYDGCEVHLYKEKSGNRATKVESVIPERIWKSIRRQMKEAA